MHVKERLRDPTKVERLRSLCFHVEHIGEVEALSAEFHELSARRSTKTDLIRIVR